MNSLLCETFTDGLWKRSWICWTLERRMHWKKKKIIGWVPNFVRLVFPGTASCCLPTSLPSNSWIFFSILCVHDWCVFVFAASFINAVASLNQFLHRGRRHAGYRTSTLSRSVLGDCSSITSPKKPFQVVCHFLFKNAMPILICLFIYFNELI